jgi:hypothetical protein
MLAVAARFINNEKGRMTIESAESSRPKRGAAGDLAESIFRLSVVIGAALNKPIKYFLSLRDFTPDGKPIEGRAERTAEYVGHGIFTDSNHQPVLGVRAGELVFICLDFLLLAAEIDGLQLARIEPCPFRKFDPSGFAA